MDLLFTIVSVKTFFSRCALSVGGTCTGEHGVGCGEKELVIEEMGDI